MAYVAIPAAAGGGSSYTFSSGLTNTAGNVTNDLLTGLAGGQTVIGGTLTTQGLTVRPNAADTTTGRTTFQGLGITLPNGTAGSPSISGATTNTGFYFSATQILFPIGGALFAYLDNTSAGAVGMNLNTNADNSGYGLGSASLTAFRKDGAGNNVGFKLTASNAGLTAAVTRMSGNSTGLAFFATAPVAQQTVGANVNNVASSGTSGQFDDFTNGTVYATDYASLHATVYQLTRSVAQLTVAVRAYGLGA